MKPYSIGIQLFLSVLLLSQSATAQETPPVRSTRYNGNLYSVSHFAWQPQFNTRVDMTIEAWVYQEEARPADLYPIAYQEDSFALFFWGGNLNFRRKAGGFASATIPVPAHQWTHIAASYDGANVKFYVDGVPAGTSAIPHDGPGAHNPLMLGTLDTHRFKGYLDEVRLWSDVRSMVEIRDNRYQELRSDADLVAVFSQGGQVEDLSGAEALELSRALPQVFGILPRDLVVPESRVAAILDGIINLDREYSGAEQLVIRYMDGEDARDAVAYLNYHRGATDWVLQIGVPAPRDVEGSWPRHSSLIDLFLDPDNSKTFRATREDILVSASLADSPSSYRVGNNFGGYTWAIPGPDESLWRTAKYYAGSDINPPSIEFQISGTLLGGLDETDGLAMGHSGVAGFRDDYMAPSDAVDWSPATWPSVTYGGVASELPRATILVRVYDESSHTFVRNQHVLLIDAESRAVLGERRDLMETGDDYYAFDNVPVPEGHTLEVKLEPCIDCHYGTDPRLTGEGIAPIEIHSARVILPPCPSPAGTYQEIEFRIRTPLPRIMGSDLSEKSGSPRIILRTEPDLKELPPDEIRLWGFNFHSSMEVYLYDCLSIPPLSDCEYHLMPIKPGTLAPNSVTVTVPEIAIPVPDKRYRIVIKDNWIRPGVIPGTPGQWTVVCTNFTLRLPLYPKVHGFEFFNKGEPGDWEQYTSVFGRSAFSPLIPCNPRPMYNVFFLFWKPIIRSSGGSCVGMAATSRQLANGTFDPMDFGAFYANGIPGGSSFTRDGNIFDPGPPRPARFDRGLPCGPWRPDNLWGRVRRNHGAQLSHQFISELLDGTDPHRWRRGDPIRVLDDVKSGAHNLLICMRRDGGGHCVTPYAVLENTRFTWGDRPGETFGNLVPDPNVDAIRVYDNNNPGDTMRFINVDKTSNRFSYRFIPPDPVTGSPGRFKYASDRLFTIPVNTFSRNLTRPTIVIDGADWLWHAVFGDADAQYLGPDGSQYGWDAEGNFVDSYPESFDYTGIHAVDNDDLRNPMLFTPPSHAPEVSRINARGPEYYFHADQSQTILQLQVRDGQAGDEDEVRSMVSGELLVAFSFTPASTRRDITATVAMDLNDGRSVAMSWEGIEVGGGQTVGFEAEHGDKAVRCHNHTANAIRFMLNVDMMDESREIADTQLFGPIDLPSGASHTLSLHEWPILQQVRSEFDFDGDGAMDHGELITSGPQPEPPTLHYTRKGNTLELSWKASKGHALISSVTGQDWVEVQMLQPINSNLVIFTVDLNSTEEPMRFFKLRLPVSEPKDPSQK